MKGHAQKIAVSHVPAPDVQVLAQRKTSSGSVNKIMLFKCMKTRYTSLLDFPTVKT